MLAIWSVAGSDDDCEKMPQDFKGQQLMISLHGRINKFTDDVLVGKQKENRFEGCMSSEFML
jgi:hypothetical protein